jgi:purine nucleoside phosphorylase
MDTLCNLREHDVDTPYGKPSDPIVTGEVDGTPVAFVARHGRGHRLIPSEVPYRANMYALKKRWVCAMCFRSRQWAHCVRRCGRWTLCCQTSSLI